MTAATLSTIERGSPRAWLLAARPQTLSAAFVPVAVGAACAYASGGFQLWPALFAFLGAAMIQIGTNFANDVFDFESGADDEDRLGPTRAAQAGLLSPASLRTGMVVSFGLAAAAGLYLTYVAGWAIIVIGVFSIASGIAYTGGPYPLGYNGLGDIFVMLFFGFVAVCGTVFVQMRAVPELAIWLSIPVGALATAILAVNNIRDRVTDIRANKRTVVVRFGHRAGVAEYAVLLLVSYVVPIALAATGRAELSVVLPVVTLPWAQVLFKRVRGLDGAALNPVLGSTAKLLLVFGTLLAIGLVLPPDLITR